MKAGALNLASPEVKIHMESAESSDPIDVKQKELMETNSLVEEFMLLANISVATKIHETFPLTAVLRQVVSVFWLFSTLSMPKDGNPMYSQTVVLLPTPPNDRLTAQSNSQNPDSLQQLVTRFTRAFSSGFVSRKSILSG